jgi:hypothetical protein
MRQPGLAGPIRASSKANATELLVQILALGQKQVDAGRTVPAREAIERLRRLRAP